jgi:superfamily II DNA or RNA helicase
MIKLRDYQEQIVSDVLNHLETNQRCCVSLATGGGKTVVFSELTNRIEGRILICVHREELVHQTSETLTKEHDILLPQIKRVSKDVVVAMVQTLHNRIKKGEININSFDTMIIDEAHRGEFMKILGDFEGKVVGFTATPNFEKNRYFFKCLKCGVDYDVHTQCCNKKAQKMKEQIPLSRYYDTLIDGIEIEELIEKGFLVKEEEFLLDVDTSRLVFDEFRGEYTEESISLVFGSPEAIENSCNVYENIALGKKTIIFNPNTIVNRKLYAEMKSRNHNAKMYDSKNSEENRAELIEWFKKTPDAILLNVQVFTTGFDCKDVDVIFLNKKTTSLNLFQQMVGRGGRISPGKFSFKLIDMGNNVQDHGSWSSERNWKESFYKCDIKIVGTPKPAAIRTCQSCEAVVAANSLICEMCGEERAYTRGGVTGLPMLNGKPVIPSPEKIIEHCLRNSLTLLHARKMVYEQVSKMFEFIPEDVFIKNMDSGKLQEKARLFLIPYYFAIQRSELEGNKNSTFDLFINKTLTEIERRYTPGRNI